MKSKLNEKVDKKLFTLDDSMTNVLSLPPKPDKLSSGILPKTINNSKKYVSGNTKDILVNKQKEKDVDELGFLSDIIGYNQLSLTKEVLINRNNGNTIEREKSIKPINQVLSQAVLEGASITMEKIRTVEDAASYFARYGSETPIKFVRLITVHDGLNFTPYDLVTTDLYDPAIEHYTMSPQGMVYMSPNEQSDCVPLSVWMRQKFNFNILRKIPFFKHYLNRKAFTTWFDNVKYQLFMKQRKKVVDKLFLSRKTCCPAILLTRNHLLSIKSVKLLNYDLKTCDKDIFIDQQISQASLASTQFEESMRRVTSEVQSVIIEVNNIYSLAYQDTSNNMLLFNDSSKPEKAKSLVKIKQEKADRKLMRQRAKLEYSTLSDFIRYMDYLCIEIFFDYTINSIQTFYNEFNKPRKQGLFETMVRFTSTGTVFNPTSQDIRDMMTKLFDNVISTVGNMNRVGYISVKGVNLNPIISANIATIINDNRQYKQTIDNIHSRIQSDYERAEEHALTFEQVRPIYDFNMTWNFEEYKSKQHDILSLKKMLELITNWSKELDKLRNKPIGILDVDSRKLKSELYPMREARLNEIKEYIKDIARVKCIQLLDHYKFCIGKFTPRPNVLKEFAKQVETVNNIKDEEKNLFIQTSQVDQMYNLLQQYDVTVPNEDVVLHEELYTRQQDYKKEMENVVQFKENKLNEMINNVNICINKLHEQILAFLDKLDDPNFTKTQFYDDADWVLDDLDLLVEKFENLNKLAKEYSSYQKLFNVPITEYAELEAGTKKVNITQKLWETVRDWGEDHTKWMEEEFTKLKVLVVNKKVNTYHNEVLSLHNTLGNPISEKLKEKVTEFKDMMPCVLDLGNKDMKPRHFEKLFSLIGQVYYPSMSYTLYQLIKGGIMKFKDIVHETSTFATGEATLEKSLTEIKDKWDKTKFIVLNQHNQHGFYVLGSVDEILSQIEDHQIILQNMLHSLYIKDISDRIYAWIAKLNTLSDTIDEWMICQKLYIYIENIFSNEDIQKQLPNETQKFLLVDKSWKTIMLRINNDPLVINSLNPMEPNTSNGGINLQIIEQMTINNEILQSIEKSLDDYLDTKRMLFPRFSYLSNNELVEIFSYNKDCQKIQRYLPKFFDSIVTLKFGDNKKTSDCIYGFYDMNDEYIELSEMIKADGQVEIWLIQLEKAMKKVVQDKLKHSFHHYPISITSSLDGNYKSQASIDWIYGYPSQVIYVMDQVMWNNDLIIHINKYIDILNPNQLSLKQFYDLTLNEIEAYVDLLKSYLPNNQATNLPTCNYSKITSLISTYLHNRDIVKNIVNKTVTSLNDYDYIKILRFYWDRSIYTEEVVIKQMNNSFKYGYEYIGCGTRLVLTPITDLCYLALTSALALKLGGSISGPTGTGKSETVKDLAKAFGNYCLVFNCNENVDYKVTSRLFSGLAQEGSWICFDEFNRLDRQIVSVIAAQILSIQQAIIKQVNDFNFNGKTIPINHNFGVFITMNPDYAKRIDLPENLKSLFRPFVIMLPDYRIILEVLLFTNGYSNASMLSQKIITLFQLCSNQLSKQSHYDFGLRSMKSIVTLAKKSDESNNNINEEAKIINAIKDVIAPRLIDSDLSVYSSLLNDIFPGSKVDKADAKTSNEKTLMKSIEKVFESCKLQKQSVFINKIIQMNETLGYCNGCMLIGETMSGKSTAIETLSNALRDHDNTIIIDKHVINPLSMSIDELYGIFNRQINEWKDGILSRIIRESVHSYNDKKTKLKWIIFDGPIDSDWIENMNSVLDDSKILCLSNSERIKIPFTVSFFFEVSDIINATPATVSRCGIIYLEQVHISILSIIRTWGSNTLSLDSMVNLLFYQLIINSCSEFVEPNQIKSILSTIEANLQVAITFIRNECIEEFTSSNNHLCVNFLNLFITQLKNNNSKSILSDNDLMNSLVVWCIIWSIGANIHDDNRIKFVEWCRLRFSTTIPSKYSLILSDPYGTYIDLNTKEIKTWMTMIKREKISFNFNDLSNLYVETADTIRYTYLLEKLVSNNFNVLYSSELSTGKTILINHYLSSIDKSNGYTYKYNYSVTTKPIDLCKVFEKHLEKKRKSLLAPFGNNTKFYLFIDDINICPMNNNNDQPVNELLRTITNGGYYDKNKGHYKNVKDIVLLGACTKPGGRYHNLNQRLLSKFHMLWMTTLSDQSIHSIYSSILHEYLFIHLPTIHITNQLIQCSIDLYNNLTSIYLPTPIKSHYLFTLRDLTKVIGSIVTINPNYIVDDNGLIKLWIHESSRVYRDRLMNDNDRNTFDDLIIKQLNISFNSISSPTNKIPASPSSNLLVSILNKDSISALLYNNYVYNDKSYRAIPPSINLSDVLLDSLNEYNNQTFNRLDIVFFPQAINHINRLTRIIGRSNSHALLIGNYGTGKKSLAKLCTYLCNYRYQSINISTQYDLLEWKDNIKDIIKSTCILNQPTAFVISDNDIIDELFLEDINTIICNPIDIHNLFNSNEMDEIINELKPLYKMSLKIDSKVDLKSDSRVDLKIENKAETKVDNKIDSREAVLNYFNQQIQKNLKIILCLSSEELKYNMRLSKYPSIFTSCTIDYYDDWTDESLIAIAQHHLSIANINHNLNIESKIPLITHLSNTFYKIVKNETIKYNKSSSNHVYLSNNYYLEFINNYIELYVNQHVKASNEIKRYNIGLNKITETETLIKSLDKSMKELKPKLESSIIDMNELLTQTTKDEIIINEEKKSLQLTVDELTTITNEMNILKQDCQIELDNILPAYDNAIKALVSIDKKSIQEIKGFVNPPDLVKYTFEAICILLGRSSIDWSEAKILLNQIDFIDKLKNYNKENINSKIIYKLEKYINDPMFTPEEVKKQSNAAMCLCMWVRALYNYNITLKLIEPKKENLLNIEKSLSDLEIDKSKKEEKLNEKINNLNILRDNIKQIEINKDTIEKSINEIIKKLKISNELINLLNYEKNLWINKLKNVTNYNNLLHCITIISSSFLTYLSCFNSNYRIDIINQWYNVLKSQQLDITAYNYLDLFISPVIRHTFELNSLPIDKFSVDNGIFITQTNNRYSIIIDPNSFALTFIKNYYKNHITIIKYTNGFPSDYVNVLEQCIKQGNACVIEDYPIMNQSIDKYINMVITTKRLNQSTITFDNRETNFHRDFKLFILNKSFPNYNYSVEIYNQFNIINFMSSQETLEEQLLVELISHEKPDLQDKLNQILISTTNDQKELINVEDDILNMLSNASENIVSNEDLVTTLGRSKNLHVTLSKRLEDTDNTSKEIRDTKEGYRMVAKRVSIIFYVISTLSSINPIYHYSYHYLITLFNQRLMKSDKKDSIRQRITGLLNDITKSLYVTIGYGLFEQHRLLYAFLLVIHINLSNQNIHTKEWDIFVNNITVDEKLLEKRPYPNSFNKSKYIYDLNNTKDTINDRKDSGASTPKIKPTNDISNSPKIQSPKGSRGSGLTISTNEEAKSQRSGRSAVSSPISNLKSPNTMGRSNNPSPNESPKGSTKNSNIMKDIKKDSPTIFINTIITKKIWQTIVMLESLLPVYDGLCADVMSKTTQWVEFLINLENSTNNEKKIRSDSTVDNPIDTSSNKDNNTTTANSSITNLPGIWETKLTEFQKLLLVRLINKEKLVSCIDKYILNQLGNYYSDSTLFNSITDIYNTTTNLTPIIYLMTPNNNPVDKIINLSKMKDIKIEIISLGHGQEAFIEKSLTNAMSQGSWVCLQNCHLADDYIPTLNNFVDKYLINHKNDTKLHKDFRLWLTTLTTTYLPIQLLNISIKISYESSSGLRSSIIKTLIDSKVENKVDTKNESKKDNKVDAKIDNKGDSKIDNKVDNKSDNKIDNKGDNSKIRSIYQRILYTVTLFHSIIIERSKYLSIGWNNNYNWSNDEYKVILSYMKTYIHENYVNISIVDQSTTIPWDILQVCITSLSYNGRITDPWDIRLLNSLTRRFIHKDILLDDYKYMNDDNYKVPPINCDIDGMIEFTKDLPIEDSTEIYGLHSNYSIIHHTNQSNEFIQLLSLSYPNHLTLSNNISLDNHNSNRVLDYIIKLSDSLPKQIDTKKASKVDNKKSSSTDSWILFLNQEVIRYNNLLNIITTTLNLLIKSLQGHITISKDIEMLYYDILHMRVPSLWLKHSYLSNKSLSSWIDDFINRIEYITLWLYEGNQRSIYWMSCYFYPNSFLIALKQIHSRETKTSIDTLTISCEVTTYDMKDIKDIKPNITQHSTIYIYGLYIEGGRYNKETLCLDELNPRQFHEMMPVLLLKPVTTETYQPSSTYLCPLYKTSKRGGTININGFSNNFIDSFYLPSLVDEDHWIQRGVAMITMIED